MELSPSPFLVLTFISATTKLKKYLYREIDNFNSTDDGKTSEKSHGATNCRQYVNKLCSSVLRVGWSRLFTNSY